MHAPQQCITLKGPLVDFLIQGHFRVKLVFLSPAASGIAARCRLQVLRFLKSQQTSRQWVLTSSQTRSSGCRNVISHGTIRVRHLYNQTADVLGRPVHPGGIRPVGSPQSSARFEW